MTASSRPGLARGRVFCEESPRPAPGAATWAVGLRQGSHCRRSARRRGWNYTLGGYMLCGDGAPEQEQVQASRPGPAHRRTGRRARKGAGDRCRLRRRARADRCGPGCHARPDDGSARRTPAGPRGRGKRRCQAFGRSRRGTRSAADLREVVHRRKRLPLQEFP